MAPAEREAHHAGAHGLGELERPHHRFAPAVAQVPLASRVGGAHHPHALAVPETEPLRVSRVHQEPVLGHERLQPVVADGAALRGGDGAVGDEVQVVPRRLLLERVALVVLLRQAARDARVGLPGPRVLHARGLLLVQVEERGVGMPQAVAVEPLRVLLEATATVQDVDHTGPQGLAHGRAPPRFVEHGLRQVAARAGEQLQLAGIGPGHGG